MILYILMFISIILAIALYWQNKRLQKYKMNDGYLQSMVKHLPIGFYIRNVEGNILLANEAFSEVTGIPKKSLENKNIKSVYISDDLKTLDSEEKEILLTRKHVLVEKNFTLKDGMPHKYCLLKTPIFDAKNEITGYIIVFRNIDKEKQLEERKESFIATLTHDLKTPTYAQINGINLLLEGKFGPLNSGQTEMIGLLQCSCKYVSDLIATILDTYKCDNGKIQLHCYEFDIAALISSLCKGTKCLADEKHQDIVFSSSEETCFVNADRLQVKRVILNFLSNAITYGFSATTINLELVNKEDEIEFSVRNKSKKISEAELSTIFERFKQTKLSCYNKISTGLGLYLSKQIIEMHGGKVFAYSFEDGTCVFGFTLPIRKETALKGLNQELAHR